MEPYRILVNLAFYRTARKGGVEVYAKELIPRLAVAAPNVRFEAIANSRALTAVKQWFPGPVTPIEYPDSLVGLAVALRSTLPGLIARSRADMLFSPTGLGPLTNRIASPSVVATHDAETFARSNFWDRVLIAPKEAAVRSSARFADIVITGSNSAKTQLVTTWNLDPSRVSVIPYGPRALPQPVDAEANLLALGIEPAEEFILAFGTTPEHKNIEHLIREYARMPAHSRPNLVLIGRDSQIAWNGLVAAMGIGDSVYQVGPVSDSTLAALYDRAMMFVMPSLGEGFGLPVVEAMSFGCPIVLSDIPVLNEVGGDAALFANPQANGSLSRAISHLAANSSLRSEMSALGLKRASLFSWEQAASHLAALIIAELSRTSNG